MPDGVLTESQLDRFRDEGYLRIGTLLDDELIGSLREEYDHVFAEARATDRQRRAFAMHYMRPGTRSQRVGAMPVSFGRPLLRLEPEGA